MLVNTFVSSFGHTYLTAVNARLLISLVSLKKNVFIPFFLFVVNWLVAFFFFKRFFRAFFLLKLMA